MEVDEFFVEQQEEGIVVRKNEKKKTVIIANERKEKSVKRMYVRVTENCSNAEFKPFFEENISKKTKLRTDGWSSFKPLNKEYPDLIQEVGGKKVETILKCIVV